MPRTRVELSPAQQQRYDELTTSVAKNVKRFREEASMTQEVLAERVGVSVRYVQHLESGNRSFTLRTAFAIGEILGVSVSALLKSHRETPKSKKKK